MNRFFDMPRSHRAGRLKLIALIALMIILGGIIVVMRPHARQAHTTKDVENAKLDFRGVTVWWGKPNTKVRLASKKTTSSTQTPNIHRENYAGPESCKDCHEKNYNSWSEHPHRWMNTVASLETVRGDFSGEAEIQYLGGKGRFYKDGDDYRMQLTRGDISLSYAIHQTIGSRFFQYYVGVLSDGPFDENHVYRNTEHVLPFGYWLDRKQWVPTVHITEELPDGERADPFALSMVPEVGRSFVPYAQLCNMCHTTFPLGDSIVRKPQVLGTRPPFHLHFDLQTYTKVNHKHLLVNDSTEDGHTSDQLARIGTLMMSLEAPEHAVTLGVSCEACHLGCEQHVANPKENPSFLPNSDCLLVEGKEEMIKTQKSDKNINWICSRCHTGPRPQLAAGMSTWNSTEFSDAIRGSCYSQLRCIDCHPPHQGIGHSWQRTPQQDDASCVRCHQQYADASAIEAHTHHPAQSTGSRCMNCHMPRLNEGLQAVVRTHTIFSPTEPRMIEANHPNACNICHTSEPIVWTLKHLKNWYGKEYSTTEVARNYPDRFGSTARGWLGSEHESVRLIATDAIARANDQSLLEPMLRILDDPFLLNRQFAGIALEKMLTNQLSDYGYRFYMTPEERRQPLQRVMDDFKAGRLKVRAAQ